MCDFIAGHYTATWNAVALGQTKPDEGFRASKQEFGEPIKGDALGQTDQDSIYLGEEHSVSMTLIEWLKVITSKIFHPWNATAGVLGPIGSLAVCGSYAKPLILTAVGGTAFSEGAPATRTYPLTILSPGFPVDTAFNPKLRETSIRLKAFPNGSSQFFTET